MTLPEYIDYEQLVILRKFMEYPWREFKRDVYNAYDMSWGPAANAIVLYLGIATLVCAQISRTLILRQYKPYIAILSWFLPKKKNHLYLEDTADLEGKSQQTLEELQFDTEMSEEELIKAKEERMKAKVRYDIFIVFGPSMTVCLMMQEMIEFFEGEEYLYFIEENLHFKKYNEKNRALLRSVFDGGMQWVSDTFVEELDQNILFEQLLTQYYFYVYKKSHAVWYLLWIGALQKPNLHYRWKYRKFRKIRRLVFNVGNRMEDLSTIEAEFLDFDVMWLIKEYIIQNKIRYYTYFSRLIRRVHYVIAPRHTRGFYRLHAFKRFDFETTNEDLWQKPDRYKIFSEWGDHEDEYPGWFYFYNRYNRADLKLLQLPCWHRYDNIGVLHSQINTIQQALYTATESYEVDPEGQGHNMFEFDIYFDSAVSSQIGFQDPATPIMEGIIDLHHDLFFFMVVISIFVVWVLSRIVYFFSIRNDEIHVPIRFTHHTTLEVVWTIIPSLILILIAVPSFALLYAMDEVINPSITIKTVGHQWYWSYEYSDQGVLAKDQILFDSYMMLEEDLTLGYLRLLEVDNRVVLPSKVHVRILITAADVLHSWAVPSLGVKLDACPGRLNQVAVYIKRNGTFYGQCSEICGVNHAFMPITVDAVSMDDYINWISAKLEENN